MSTPQKKPLGFIKLSIKAGSATPAYPVGPALGAKGLNIMEFCKSFNALTASLEPEHLTVKIHFYQDKTWTFVVKQPSISYLLKKLAKIEKGSSLTKKNGIIIAKITKSDCYEHIVKRKMQDSNAFNEEALFKSILGTASSMGIEIIED